MKIHWFDLLVGTVGIAAGCFGIGYAVRTKHQMDDICEKVNKSVDEVSRNVSRYFRDCYRRGSRKSSGSGSKQSG